MSARPAARFAYIPRCMDEATRALFALPVAAFTAARNELATAVKKQGDAARSKEIKALARPSVSAWATNQLYRAHEGAFAELLGAGEELRAAAAASLRGEGADALRAAQKRQTELVHALRVHAEALLAADGHGANPATLERIGRTLVAISSRGSFAPFEPGCLSADVDPPGFDELATIVATAPQRPVAAPSTPSTPSTSTQTVAASAPEPSPEERAAAEAKARAVLEATLREKEAWSALAAARQQAETVVRALAEARENHRAARVRAEEAAAAARAAAEAEAEVTARAAALVKTVEEAERAHAAAKAALTEIA